MLSMGECVASRMPVLGLSEAKPHDGGVQIQWDQILIHITVMLILF